MGEESQESKDEEEENANQPKTPEKMLSGATGVQQIEEMRKVETIGSDEKYNADESGASTKLATQRPSQVPDSNPFQLPPSMLLSSLSRLFDKRGPQDLRTLPTMKSQILRPAAEMTIREEKQSLGMAN